MSQTLKAVRKIQHMCNQSINVIFVKFTNNPVTAAKSSKLISGLRITETRTKADATKRNENYVVWQQNGIS